MVRLVKSADEKLILFDCKVYRDRIEAGAAYLGGELPECLSVESELNNRAIVALPLAYQKVKTSAFEVNVVLRRVPSKDL